MLNQSELFVLSGILEMHEVHPKCLFWRIRSVKLQMLEILITAQHELPSSLIGDRMRSGHTGSCQQASERSGH